ncbi:MAG: hypothetical protein KBONHNOK_01141 [Candidatus Methanoperedenaceae archaeon GB50]|nr:MAG: hypothetical protein KBONHNOK_01141 [Candidatus Methanoperedenaceae archaeon GB50]
MPKSIPIPIIMEITPDVLDVMPMPMSPIYPIAQSVPKTIVVSGINPYFGERKSTRTTMRMPTSEYMEVRCMSGPIDSSIACPSSGLPPRVVLTPGGRGVDSMIFSSSSFRSPRSTSLSIR